MDLNTYLMSQRVEFARLQTAKHIQCVDGFSISVQASRHHYCLPRRDIGPWEEVECGFPSETPHGIMGYAEEPAIPTETVYGNVPVKLVEQLIQVHGGMKEE